jgi:hypothetical protein
VLGKLNFLCGFYSDKAVLDMRSIEYFIMVFYVIRELVFRKKYSIGGVQIREESKEVSTIMMIGSRRQLRRYSTNYNNNPAPRLSKSPIQSWI